MQATALAGVATVLDLIRACGIKIGQMTLLFTPSHKYFNNERSG